MEHKSTSSILTQRLTLHALTDSDRDATVELLTHPKVGETYMVPDFQSREEAAKLFERLKKLSETEDRFLCGIYQEDCLIGLIHDVDIQGDELELGYVIHPDRWHEGFATEALTAAIEELFRRGYQVVRAGAFEENRASIRVMEKSGMTGLPKREEIEYRGKIHRCVFFEKRKGSQLGRFVFRNVLPNEFDQAVEIEQICFPPNEACSEQHMKERMAKAPELFLVGVDRENGRIAGLLNGLSTDEEVFRDEFFTDAELYDPHGKQVMLLGLDVRPEYRRQGLGTALMEEYARREKENGRRWLILTCLQEKVEMYKKMKYRDDGISASTWGGEEWHEMRRQIF